ncbi:MAG: hypothetical protein HOM58_14280 [Rhodospirillaceae bacterium]|jgi:hypothetical protein|nr:hypothetical protein [Rhodospirillaceae bacterium]
MPSILSVEHCARVSSFDDTRRKFQKAKKMSNRAKLACFVVFNIAVWGALLLPVLFR